MAQGTTVGSDRVVEYLKVNRKLSAPESLVKLFKTAWPPAVAQLLYRPTDSPELPWDLGTVEALIDASAWPLLPNLVPLMAVDEKSFACVVASDLDDARLPGEGAVVRWHVEVSGEQHQAALLDVDCFLYVQSVKEELAARQVGLDRMLYEVGPTYKANYIDRQERPRDFVVRPVRLACQNVIIGLAAIAQESSFDGLAVVAWQTCEVPHVAAHEANRALAALTLCDAFQNGGTMEIRFDRRARVLLKGPDGRQTEKSYPHGHPEHRVPASLRRYGRTVHVELGTDDDPGAISPGQARRLFEAVTPMPDGLRARFQQAVHQQGMSPERLCFALLKPVWRDIELDYLLATSARVDSILSGGASWQDRYARQAESEVCRVP